LQIVRAGNSYPGTSGSAWSRPREEEVGAVGPRHPAELVNDAGVRETEGEEGSKGKRRQTGENQGERIGAEVTAEGTASS